LANGPSSRLALLRSTQYGQLLGTLGNCTAIADTLREAIVLSTIRDDGQPWGRREERRPWGVHLLTISNTSLATAEDRSR
jgi:hypothetical protein